MPLMTIVHLTSKVGYKNSVTMSYLRIKGPPEALKLIWNALGGSQVWIIVLSEVGGFYVRHFECACRVDFVHGG